MKRKIATLEDLRHIESGIVPRLVEHSLRQVANDIEERPGLKAKRAVLIKLEFVPEVDNQGTLRRLGLTPTVETKIPPQKVSEYDATLSPTGDIVINDLSREDVKQMTIDEATEEAN
jgi:hypothetical protein